MPALTAYKKAELYNAGGDITKRWYVQYWFRNPATGEHERFKPTFNINRIHDPAMRIAYSKEAVKFMNEQLKSGYDPFKELAEMQALKIPLQEIIDELKAEVILSTVARVKDQLVKAATRSAKNTYRGMYNRFEKFIIAKELKALTVEEFNVEKCYELQEYLKDEMHLGKKTVNTTISHIGLFWDQKEIRNRVNGSNPLRSVVALKNKNYRGKKKLKPTKDTDFIPLTATEMDKVIDYYKSIKAYKFLRVLGFIFYAWVRPVEITRLKVGDIDMQHKTIRFLKENTKDNEYAHVQIVDELYELLVGMELHKYPSGYYLFSDNLVPGETQLNAWRHLTEKWWTPYVVTQLGIPKKLYAVKHTGNIEFIQKNKGNLDIKWQQMQNRHSSADVTEKYLKRLGVYFVDTQQFKFRKFI